MNYWIQLYRECNGGFHESVAIRIPATWALQRMFQEARAQCVERQQDGWRIVRGQSLLNPFHINGAVQPAGQGMRHYV